MATVGPSAHVKLPFKIQFTFWFYFSVKGSLRFGGQFGAASLTGEGYRISFETIYFLNNFFVQIFNLFK